MPEMLYLVVATNGKDYSQLTSFHAFSRQEAEAHAQLWREERFPIWLPSRLRLCLMATKAADVPIILHGNWRWSQELQDRLMNVHEWFVKTLATLSHHLMLYQFMRKS